METRCVRLGVVPSAPGEGWVQGFLSWTTLKILGLPEKKWLVDTGFLWMSLVGIALSCWYQQTWNGSIIWADLICLSDWKKIIYPLLGPQMQESIATSPTTPSGGESIYGLISYQHTQKTTCTKRNRFKMMKGYLPKMSSNFNIKLKSFLSKPSFLTLH